MTIPSLPRSRIWNSFLVFTLLLGFISVAGPQTVVQAAPNTWTLVDSMNNWRFQHTATLLNDGRVLVVGSGSSNVTELYDPSTDTWTNTGSLSQDRERHAAVLLADGRVMVVGGYGDGIGSLASTEIYDPVTGTWSDAGDLNEERLEHTATLLPDGRVLVVGGFSNTDICDSAELYDPATDTWTAVTDNLYQARYQHTASILTDGRVMVVGGWGGGALNTTELFDPTTETWTTAAGTLNVARNQHVATVLVDGRVLVAGGRSGSSYLATAELYDPVADSWTTTAGDMSYARIDHTATLLPDGKVLIAGGYYYDSSGVILPIVELFDPSTATFSPTDNLNHSRRFHTATLLPDGRVLVAGGYSGSSLPSAEIYDHAPTTPTWTAGESMNTSRYEFAATLLADGRFLVSGGVNSDQTSAEIYDPTSDTWTLTGSMVVSRTNHTMTLLPDGRVLVAGGYRFGDGYLSSAEIYDPETEAFTLTGSMTTPRYHHATTLLPDGRVLVTGGYNDADKYLSGAEIYDPNSGTWTAAEDMSGRRGRHTATLLSNGQVLVAGGYDISNGYLNSVELYDPLTDTWTGAVQMSARRLDHTATLLPSGQVMVAGGTAYGLQLSSVELYDPETDTWQPAQSMTDERALHTALLLPDGRVIVAGGRYSDSSLHYLASVERYDPITDTWDTLEDLTIAREEHAVALLLDGRVIVTGGKNSFTLSSTELYDPVLTYNVWQTTGSLNTARYIHTATLLADGRALLVGGMGDTTGAELYDPATGTLTDTGSLSAGRFAHTATRLADGKVLVAGGLSGASATATAEVYNPATGIFLATTGNMGTARHSHSATRLPDGQVLIAGGTDASSNYLASAELYDPASGTFTDTGSLARQRSGHTASLLPDGDVLIAGGSGYLAQSERYDFDTGTFADTTGDMTDGRIDHTATTLLDGRVLVTGGRNSSMLDSTEVYDPDTDSWSTTDSLNAPRYKHAAALLPDGRVLVVGGYDDDSTTYLDSAEVYDPASGTWTVVDSLSDARMDHTVTALENGRVLVAGGADGAGLASAELYVEGRPWLEDVTSPIRVGDPLTATGTTFRTRPEGSGGGHRSSATNYPLVQLMRLDNEQVRWLPVDATTPFSDTAFTSLPVEDWAAGYARATVFVNGIPSLSRMVQVLPQLGAVIDVDPAQNTHTAPLTASLTISITEGLAVSNTTSQTVIVQSGFQGPITGTFSFGSVVFDPAADFHPGELVETTVTTGVIANRMPLSDAFVWQFRTATSGELGVFSLTDETMAGQSYDVALGDVNNDGYLDVFLAYYHIFPGSSYRGNRVWLNDGAGNFVSNGQTLGNGMSRGVALGDLDGDGDLDAYVANEGNNQVWINQGGDQEGTLGIFAAGQSMGSFTDIDVALGDVDGDGDLDAVTAVEEISQASRVWLNDGSGTFSQAQGLSSGMTTRGASLGDLDRDGDLDVVLANAGGDPQHVYLNDGSGVFAAHPVSPTFGSDPSYEVELGDLDDDGDLDAFTANQSVTVPDAVWLNDGTGGFSLHQELNAEYSRGIALGDVDADGDLDAWITHYWVGQDGTGPSELWLNDGSATFTEWQETDGSGQDAGMGDIDGDGDLDVVISHGRVWMNLTPGEVTDVNPASNSHTAPLTTSLTITTDVVVDMDSVTTETIMVHGGFQGRMDGTLSAGSIVFDPAADFHPGELVRTTVTTDVTANGMPLVAPYIWQFRTAVEGGRGWFVDSGQALGSNNARTAELADLDGDGDLDAFVSNYEQANTAWLNDGSGTYQQVWTDTVSGSSYPFGIALGDLDGDGDLDVYEATMWSLDRVLMNNGDGTFSQNQTLPSGDGRDVDLADLDGDGDLDAFVATASIGDPPNQVYLNQGNGTLVSGQSMNSPRSYGVALGDVDDDGDLDAFVANTGDGSPQGPNEVWLNNGDGTFTDSGQPLGMAESWSVDLGDLDGDGDLDAFVANDSNEPNTVWFNDGTGHFTDSGQTLGTGSSRHIELGDVDGDGDLDAFVSNYDTPNQVWINDGSGAFDPSEQGDIGSNGQGLSLGDVDSDGDLDAFIAMSSADQVWFNQNTADLSIEKTVFPPAVAPDGMVTYTLVYTNNGPEIASGVVITDHVPVTLTQVHYDASPPVTPTGSVSFTWDVGRLDVGERGTITVTGVVSTGVTGVFSLTNEAVITSSFVFDGDLDNNASTVSNTVEAIAPQVLAASPADGAADVALTAPVVITFSEAIEASTLAYSVNPDPGGWSEAWNGAGTVVTLTHAAFTGETVYTVTVTAADDPAGNPLADTPYIWSFETERHLIYVPTVLNEFDG